MLKELRKLVCDANLELARSGLVALTWGNVSGLDAERGLMVIKPSGVPYVELEPEHMVVLDLDGTVVEGSLNASSDTATHLVLYKSFSGIGGVTHTHSIHATMFAQACREIPCLGTTHADHFSGPVPLTRMLTDAEVANDYEGNTGNVIVERFDDIDPQSMSAVLAAGHGPFTWGAGPDESVRNSVVLETVAEMAFGSFVLNAKAEPIPDYLLKKHYSRKHGPGATYGQVGTDERDRQKAQREEN